MISLIKIFSALSCLLISVSYGLEKGTPHGTVIDLTDETFDDLVTTDPANGLWLLKFYAPWLVNVCCSSLDLALDLWIV